METIEITSLDDSRVSMFCRLTEAQLRMELEPEKGLFIAESPKVIRLALDYGWVPTALLCERKHIEGDARDIVERSEKRAGTYLYWQPRAAGPADGLYPDARCALCHAPPRDACHS